MLNDMVVDNGLTVLTKWFREFGLGVSAGFPS